MRLYCYGVTVFWGDTLHPMTVTATPEGVGLNGQRIVHPIRKLYGFAIGDHFMVVAMRFDRRRSSVDPPARPATQEE